MVLGLQVPDLTVVENETFSVCIQITAGSLERDVFIGVEAENSSSAEGNAVTLHNIYVYAHTNTSCSCVKRLLKGISNIPRLWRGLADIHYQGEA